MTYIDQVPKAVLKIMNTFEQSGFECYLVDGCVRDLLIGREPDWLRLQHRDDYDRRYGL
jgi:tRNA nucleotidyltransferase/poly(A) polymerase